MAILSLDEVTERDQSRSGGKAYNCARLKHADFNVPDGLVVPAGARDEDLALVGRHPWFDSVAGDALFAVRSSGIGEGPALFAIKKRGCADISIGSPRSTWVRSRMVAFGACRSICRTRLDRHA